MSGVASCDDRARSLYPSVELRELSVFLTVAEELHFGRAAERLRITPSHVSHMIRSLEAKLGGRLFARTSRRVSLTPLGVEFDGRVRPLHNEMLAAVEAISASTSQARGALRIGVTVNTDRPSVHRLLNDFRRSHPACEVSIKEVDIWEPYAPLRGGEIDVLCNWLAVDEPDLEVGPVIERCERVLIVGSRHRLAKEASVRSEDLAGERLNRPPRRFPKALADAILLPRTSAGRPIARTNQELESVPEVVAEIARGHIVSLNQRGTFRFDRADIVVIPVTDLPPLPLGLIWRSARENPWIRALADTAPRIEAETWSWRSATPAVAASSRP
jgi:DNA-binding transcriptional LysR family regulator